VVARATAAVATAAVCLSALTGCGGSSQPVDWPRANLDLSSTRSLPGSGIDAANVSTLHVAWRFRFPFPPGESGAFTATPVVANGVVYVQDMDSNVFALDLATGKLIWRRLFKDTNPGPNGIAVVNGYVFGATDTSAFALNASSGKLIWRHFLVTATATYVDIAPQVANDLVYVATIGLPPNGKGVLYALDAATGALRWQFNTIKSPWHIPEQAGGGGAWYPPSVVGDQVFWGTTNPYPYGGSVSHPNGGAYAGPALYTDSMLVLDARSGKLLWFDQVTPHDVRDYDFEATPVLGTSGGRDAVFGAGKAGFVIAWDRTTHKRLWRTAVGKHQNDTGLLPPHRVTVCPGLLGGVETPMASAGGRLYVPVVNLCMHASSTGYENLDDVDVPARGTGELVALDEADGKTLWTLHLPQAVFGCATAADGVVFTSTFDGKVYGVDAATGKVLWSTGSRAGINACPALAAKTLLVGAGVKLARGDVPELTAFTLGKHT